MSPLTLLKFALAVVGTILLLVYPLAIVWPSGWAWHGGAPHDWQYFMMIVGVYATLGIFLVMAARNPQAHRSLIWFAVWSSVVHGAIMAVQSMPAEHHGHLLGDVPALFLVAIVLGGLLVWSDAGQGKTASIGPEISDVVVANCRNADCNAIRMPNVRIRNPGGTACCGGASSVRSPSGGPA
jgi:uncharacterized protein DUF6632